MANQFNTGAFGQVIPGPAPPVTPGGTQFGSGPGTIVYRALRLAGGIQTGTIPEPEMVEDLRDECNSMLDSWNAQELAQQFIDDRYFDITVAQQSYTLGPTGDFSTDANGVPLLYRPQQLVAANFILLTNVVQPDRIPLRIIRVQDWSQIPVIAVNSLVTHEIYVQTTKNNVTIWCFPYPQPGNQFEFFMWSGFGRFESSSSYIEMNPAGLDALVYNLAARALAYLPKDKGRLAANRVQWLERKAIETRREFDRSNAPTVTLDPDCIFESQGGNGSPFNYLDGSFSY